MAENQPQALNTVSPETTPELYPLYRDELETLEDTVKYMTSKALALALKHLDFTRPSKTDVKMALTMAQAGLNAMLDHNIQPHTKILKETLDYIKAEPGRDIYTWAHENRPKAWKSVFRTIK